MKILYFATTAFYQKPNPSFHLMSSQIEDLLKYGHEIYYVGVEEIGLEKHIPDSFIDHPKFHYCLVQRRKTEKKNFVRRYLKGIRYAIKARKYIKRWASICDVAFLQSSPTIMYNAVITRSLMKGKKIVMNIQDMFPGSSIASGVMPYKWMQYIFYHLQKIAYRSADVVVGISEDMRVKLIEQGVPRAKTEVILNWFDDNSVTEVAWERNRFVQKYSMSKTKFYVQYAGTMGYVFDYKMVLKVAELLREYPQIEIQMIGEGSQKKEFITAAEALGLKNISFLPLEPQHMVSDVYSACSVCFIPLKHGIIGNSVPSKAGLLMACKRPIITSVDYDSIYAKEFNDNKIGIACPDNDPESVVKAILYLYKNPSEAHEMGIRGYEYGRARYSRTVNMAKYNCLFEHLIKMI